MPNSYINAISSPASISGEIYEALIHYATFSNDTAKMQDSDLMAIAAVIRRRSPCNLLVFGLGHETLLFKSLNHGGRTVFLDESEYYISIFEHRHPNANLEAYDVSYATRLSDFRSLLAVTKSFRKTECRPVQNLLFSDCKLAINDLPNNLYDVSWDVIVVDGPRGYYPDAPGRMGAIFTSGVMARSGSVVGKKVDVFVHDYEREVERVSSLEFLCLQNLVSIQRNLAHFVVATRNATGAGAAGEEEFEFCLKSKEETNKPTEESGTI